MTATDGNSSADCYNSFLALRSYLFDPNRYSPRAPPFLNQPSPSSETVVTISFFLIKFFGLTGSVFSIYGALDMTWRDPQLAWSPDVYPCAPIAPFVAGDVWHPYIILYNSASSSSSSASSVYEMADDTVITVNGSTGESDGRIYGEFEAGCSTNLRLFPFDSHSCELIFTFEVTHLKFALSGGGDVHTTLSDSTANSGWEITSMQSFNGSLTIATSRQNLSLSMFNVKFSLKRKAIFFVVNLVIPAVILMVVVALNFVLPSDRGLRIPLTATLMLSIFVQLTNLAKLMPSTTEIPYIITIYVVQLCLSAVSLVLAVFAAVFRIIAPNLPLSVQQCLLNKVGRACCLQKISQEADCSVTTARTPVELVSEEDKQVGDNNPLTMQIAKLANAMEQILQIKKDKLLASRRLAINESALQKFEFLVNAILLLIYITVVCYMLISYSVAVGRSIL